MNFFSPGNSIIFPHFMQSTNLNKSLDFFFTFLNITNSRIRGCYESQFWRSHSKNSIQFHLSILKLETARLGALSQNTIRAVKPPTLDRVSGLSCRRPETDTSFEYFNSIKGWAGGGRGGWRRVGGGEPCFIPGIIYAPFVRGGAMKRCWWAHLSSPKPAQAPYDLYTSC